MIKRLTQLERKNIVTSESDKKFGDVGKKITDEIKVEIEGQIKASVPSWITKDMIESKFIYTSCSYDIKSFRYQDRRKIEAYLPTISSFPSMVHECHNLKYSIKLKKLIKSVREHKKDIEDFNRSLRILLYGVSTHKQMVKLLPELKKYELEPEVKALVPVDQIDKMRKMLK